MTYYKKISFLIAIMIIVVSFVDYGIVEEDIRFYMGKDDGFSLRFESVCCLSAIFYSAVTTRNRIAMFFVGILIGVLCSIISYLIWFFCLNDRGLSFQVITCFLFTLTFFILKKVFPYFS